MGSNYAESEEPNSTWPETERGEPERGGVGTDRHSERQAIDTVKNAVLTGSGDLTVTDEELRERTRDQLERRILKAVVGGHHA